MTDIEFTRLDTRDSWMEAMATLTDSEDEDTVGIATLPSFKRRTGEDAVSLHDHDGAGAHDHDPLRCHHSTFKRRTGEDAVSLLQKSILGARSAPLRLLSNHDDHDKGDS